MKNFRFKAASRDEKIVYGSERPGYPKESVGNTLVMDWIQFMENRGIKRVCCLLTKDSLDYYDEDLLRAYRQGLEMATYAGRLSRTFICLTSLCLRRGFFHFYRIPRPKTIQLLCIVPEVWDVPVTFSPPGSFVGGNIESRKRFRKL